MLDNSDSIYHSRSISETSSVHSQNDPLISSVVSFFEQLNKKGLFPQLMERLFFSSPLYLFADLKQVSVEELKQKILKALPNLINSKEELQFLKKFSDLKKAFLKEMNNTLFSGMLIYILCFIFKFNCKIFQFHDRKSLVSCDIDLDGVETLKIAIIIFNQGFQFCLLKKIEK